MNIDPSNINQMLNMIPYPIGKSNLIQLAQQFGANDQIMGVLNKLPDKTFNSAQELQDALGGMTNMGNLGGMFKR